MSYDSFKPEPDYFRDRRHRLHHSVVVRRLQAEPGACRRLLQAELNPQTAPLPRPGIPEHHGCAAYIRTE